ncbi:Conidiation-specific protein 6 [Fusarium oxysporum f. sp. conglutinans]|nr:Conidiation-specific protein 6 [Fusarium oxysporum f. sp. conglutinans]
MIEYLPVMKSLLRGSLHVTTQQAVLENEFNGGEVTGAEDNKDKNPGNVAGGLKATLNNPNVSDEAKKNAKERLDKEDF